MALASYVEARSPVELSLSPVYHYQYSSISKTLSHLVTSEDKRLDLQMQIQELCMSYYLHCSTAPFWLLKTDTSPLCKAHSPTLKDRSFIAVPNNVIKGNKPLSIGYETSYINLSDMSSSWSLPLSICRVGCDQSASQCAHEQLAQLFSHPKLGLKEKFVVNALDSKYGNAAYLAPVHGHENLVNLARFRSGMKVWDRYVEGADGAQGSKTGAPKVYKEKYYLINESGMKAYKDRKTKAPYQVFQRSIFDRPADERLQFCEKSARGRKLLVELFRYKNMMIRSKNGNVMKDKPFDLIAAKVSDAESGKAVFKRAMFIAVSGKRKDEITTHQAYISYRHRYDIEPYFRFSKQQLILEHFHTPSQQHLDNWLIIQQLCAWLLYAASDEADFRPRKWEQYLPKNKQVQFQPRLSIAQIRKAAQKLFLTFKQAPFKPGKSKKGKGRTKGMTFEPRRRYKVIKKTTSKRKLEQIE